jgi:ABC-2 type transport system ATP-binding protein
MIEVEGLTKFYGTRKAIDNLTFKVNKGEVLGFLGPNGAGKSTTMKILTCFMPASSGKAVVAGFDVFENPLEVKKRVGYLPETPPVYKDMVVQDYLEYTVNLHGVFSKKAKALVDSAIEKCGLSHVRGRLIGNLSKGYRQRVGIAQAIAHNPDVLILDEPTVGLDPKQIIEIRELIKSLSGDHTIILSTHILPEVEATCNRVLIINEGKIVAIDTISAIVHQLRKGNTFSVLVENPTSDLLEKLQSIQGVVSVSLVNKNEKESQFSITLTEEGFEKRAQIAKTIIQNNCGLLEFKRESLSLEDVFLKLTTEEKH